MVTSMQMLSNLYKMPDWPKYKLISTLLPVEAKIR